MWTQSSREFAESVVYRSVRLATLAAIRADRNSIDWIEPLVFKAILETLGDHEVPRKVAAEMLGLSRRGLLKKIQRHEVPPTREGLFDALVSAIDGPTDLTHLLGACSTYDEQTVRSMVNDLCRSGVLIREDDTISRASLGGTTREQLEELAFMYRGFPALGIGREEFVRLFEDSAHDLVEIWDDANRSTVSGRGSAWVFLRLAFSNTAHFIEKYLTTPADKRLDFGASVSTISTSERTPTLFRAARDAVNDVLAPHKDPDGEQSLNVSVIFTYDDFVSDGS